MSGDAGGETSIFTGITRKTLLILLNFVITGLIGVISWKFVATYLTAPQEGVLSEVGVVNFAIGFAGMFSFLTNLGFGSAHIKRVSEGKNLGECIGTYFTIQVVTVLIFVGTVLASIFVWKNIIGKGFESPQHEYTIYIILGYFAANNLANVGLQTFIGRIEIAKNQLVVLAGAAVQLVVTIIVVVNTNDMYLYALTFVIGAFVNLSVSYFYLLRLPIRRPTWTMMKSYFVFSVPMFVVTAMAQLTMNIDRVMIQLFWESSEVAIYVGGQKFSNYLIMISTGLGMILFPTFSSMKAKGKDNEIKGLVHLTERLITLIVSPLCVIVFVLSLPIVTLLGDASYSASYLVLQPLAAWSFLKALSAPYRNLIMGIGKPVILALISAISLAAIVLLNLVFIPKDLQLLDLPLLGLGARGAAIASLIAALISFLLFRIFTYRYERVFLNFRIFKVLLPSFLMGGALFALNYYFPADNFFLLVIYGTAGLLLYIGLLFIFRSMDREDKELFKNVLNPFTMLRYIWDELIRNKHEN